MIVVSGDNSRLAVGFNRFYFTVIGDYLSEYNTVATIGRFITSLDNISCSLPFTVGSTVLTDINPVEASQSSTYTRRLTGKSLHYIEIDYDGLSTGELKISLDVTYEIDKAGGVDTLVEESVFTLYLPTTYELEDRNKPLTEDYYPRDMFVSDGNKGGEFVATDDTMNSVSPKVKFSLLDNQVKGYGLPSGSNPSSILFQLAHQEYDGEDPFGIVATALAVSRSETNILDNTKGYANLGDNPSILAVPSSISYSAGVPQVPGVFGNIPTTIVGDEEHFSWGVRVILQSLFNKRAEYPRLVTDELGNIDLKYGGITSQTNENKIEYCQNRTLYFWNKGETTNTWRDTQGIPFSLELIKMERGYLLDIYNQNIVRTWIVPKPNRDIFKTIDYNNFDKYMANENYMESYGIDGNILNVHFVQEIYISNLRDENEDELPFYVISVIFNDSNVAEEYMEWGDVWGSLPWKE